MTLTSINTHRAESITVLVSKDHRQSCSKKYSVQDDGKIQSENYPNIYTWNVQTFDARDTDELLESVQAISRRRNAIAIFGALVDDKDPRATDSGAGVNRRYKDRPNVKADFEPCPRAWVAIDIDEMIAPKSMLGRSPARLAEWARKQLPERFQKAACVYQYTSSYQVRSPGNVLYLRFWFLLDDDIDVFQWRAYWKAHGIADPSLYNPVQPIYTAPPTFGEGVKPPIKMRDRVGALDGDERVAISDLKDWMVAEAEKVRSASDTVDYDPGFEPNMEEVSLAMHRIVKQKTQTSRHHHAYGAAHELVAIGCPGEKIVDFLEGPFLHSREEERDINAPNEMIDIVREAVGKFKAGTLTSNKPPLSSVLGPIDDKALYGDTLIADTLDSGDVEDMLGYGASPYSNAQIFLKRNYDEGGLLRSAQNDWEWDGTRWKIMGAEALCSRVVKDAECSASAGKGITETVRSLVLQEDLRMPGWISDPHRAPAPMAVFANGMISLEDLTMDPDAKVEPHDKDFFNTVVLPYDHSPKATCLKWEKFVDDCFDTDAEKKEFRKFFGYILTQRNDLQKFFLLQGPPRAGKGVVMAVLKELMGEENAAFPMLSELANDFAMQPLVGKPIIFIDEANSPLTGRGQERVIDLLKAVTGGSPLQINRKKKDHLQGVKLPGRFVVACNRLPSFLDPSGAIIARMIPFIFKQSFVGREDIGLADRLKTELPGIFNWAVQGMRDLIEDGGAFSITDNAKAMLEGARRAAAPVYSFCQDCLTVSGVQEVLKEDLYRVYTLYCLKNGNKPLADNRFHSEIQQTYSTVRSEQSRANGRKRSWVGIGLNEEGMEILNPTDDDSLLDDLME